MKTKKPSFIVIALALIALAGCTPSNNSGLIIIQGGSTVPNIEYAKAIPDAELAFLGLQGSGDHGTYSVSHEFKAIEAGNEENRSSTSFYSRSVTYSMISKVALDGYEYNGNTYSTQAGPAIIIYPAVAGSDSSYTISEFTIEEALITVRLNGEARGKDVGVDGISGHLFDDETKVVNITANSSDGTVESIANAPQSSESIVMDKYKGSYTIGNDVISKPESIGITGETASPFTIETADEIADLNEILLSGTVIDANIRLDADIELTTQWIIQNPAQITIGNNQNVNIDFNHHTITFAGVTGKTTPPILIEEGGTLTINNGSDNAISENDGGIHCTGASTRGVFEVKGSLVVNGGDFHIVGYTGVDYRGVIFGYSDSRITINNGRFYVDKACPAFQTLGTAVINDGFFWTNSHNGMENYFAYCIITNGDLTVNGGEVHGIQGGLGVSGGKLTVNDVDVYAKDRAEELGYTGSKVFYALYVSGEAAPGMLTVNGGNFISDNTALWVGNSNEGGDGGLMLEASAKVKGGYFESTSHDYDVRVDHKLGALELAGGTFKHDKVFYNSTYPTLTESGYIADGYKVESTENGFSIVPEK